MGRSRYKIYENNKPHFLTCTINEWIPIFTRPATTQIILDSFSYRQQNENVKLYAYVILENHLHCIIQTDNLNKLFNLVFFSIQYPVNPEIQIGYVKLK